METATKYCQPIPPTFVSFQPTEPFRAVPHDQQRSQGTFKPNENHEVQETYAEIHYPPQNGTETQPNVTKVDQEQEFQELNQSISSNEGQDQSSHQNHTACQDDRKIVEKKHSDETFCIGLPSSFLTAVFMVTFFSCCFSFPEFCLF
jgi:hypothetical protein